MSDETKDSTGQGGDDFARSAQGGGGNFLSEFWGYLRHSKKWWLAPILILLLLLTALSFAAGTGVAPFIYALF